jgi:RecB family exonuclease
MDNVNKLSKSSFGTFLECRRKFLYSKLGYPRKENPIMQYGTDMHKILEKFNTQLLQATGKKITIKAEFAGNFEAYNKFYNRLVKEGYKIVASEQSITVGDITGIVDAIFTNGKEYIVIDFKTVTNASKTFDKNKYRQELLLYAYLVSTKYNIDITMASVGILRMQQKGKEFDINMIEFKTEEVSSLIFEINKVVDFLKNAKGELSEFPVVDPTKSCFACQYCDYNSICVA